ncbi:MAG: 1-acyl-sn-glycerol-3-phosphate acyltransferase [Pseudomonadales bacterium]|nr:1-acyl-sn-glycerol-3-phosphate acyltransferase [Pseudomonadales bacterium]
MPYTAPRFHPGSCIIKSVARFLLWLGGWKISGQPPDLPRYVLVAAPHTSNWDFVWVMAIAVRCGVRISWFAKDAMFIPPFGTIFRRFGGIPVDRSTSTDLVARLTQRFAESEKLILTVPVEGTRGYVPHWKSGFYRIAMAAGVPVVLGHLNYRTRVGGFGRALHLTGNVSADMDQIRDFYKDAHGKYPDLASPMRLKEEQSDQARGD